MNLKRIFLISCIVSLIVCAVPVLASTLTFTVKDDGTIAQVSPGDTIVLSLVQNPSTGFNWDMHTSRELILENTRFGVGFETITWTYTVSGEGMLFIYGYLRQGEIIENTFELRLKSEERNYQNARSIQWGEIVPRFDRLEMDLDRLEELTNRYPERLGFPREA